MGVLNMQMGQKAAARQIASVHCDTRELGSLRETAQGEKDNKRVSKKAFTLSNINDVEERLKAKTQDLNNLIDAVQDKQTDLQRKFDLFMGGVIVTNVLWIAIEMDFGPEEGTKVSDRLAFWAVSSTFLLLFTIEIFVRLYWERSAWIYGFWNWFDLVVVACAVTDVWVLPFLEGAVGSLQSLAILRLARLVRLVRMVKLVRTMHSLYVMTMAFLHALKSMAFLGVIMFFGMLIYAIFATMLIGRNSTFDGVRIMDDSVDDRFGKVYRSMYSLFELMTLEGWEQVARPLVERNPLAFVFIGSFIMIFTYGMLNMIVATVVEKTMEQSHAMKEYDHQMEMVKIHEELLTMKKMFEASDEDHSGALTENEFAAALQQNEFLKKTLEKLGVPANDAKELFMILDYDSNQELSIAEFVSGVGKLRSGGWDALHTDACIQITRSEVLALREQMSQLTAQNSAWQQSVETRLTEQGLLLREQSKLMQEVLACVRAAPNAASVNGAFLPADRHESFSPAYPPATMTSADAGTVAGVTRLAERPVPSPCVAMIPGDVGNTVFSGPGERPREDTASNCDGIRPTSPTSPLRPEPFPPSQVPFAMGSTCEFDQVVDEIGSR